METRYPSPDGKYIFQIFPWEARMSLWIESPRLMDTIREQSVLHFTNSNWSLDDAQWQDAERVKMQLRRYPGDHTPSSFEVVVDCQNGQATVEGKGTVALGEVEDVLDELIRCGRAKSHSTPSPKASPGGLAAVVKRFIG